MTFDVQFNESNQELPVTFGQTQQVPVFAKVDQSYNPESTYAQSGIAVEEAITNAKNSGELKGEKGDKGDKGDDYVLTDADKQEIVDMTKPIIDEAISLKADVEFKAFDTDFSLVDGADGVHIEPFTKIGTGDLLFFGENKVVMEPFDYSYLTAFNVGDIYRITIANQQVVSVEKILKIADVDAQLGKIERRYFGPIIPVYDNVTYYATNEISDIEIVYPEGDFICSLTFTTAAEGDITIYLPESKYIGGIPSFGNGETWELNIKNGVVVGGLIE